jgi:hypothetical protein
MKKISYTWSEEGEQMRKALEDAVKMTSASINFNYPHIKISGEGYNQLVGVGGLLSIVGVERAAKMIKRANACLGDVCRCKVYGGVQVSFYIH